MNSPLSLEQERLWFFERADPGNTTNIIGTLLPLRGVIDRGSWDAALARLIARHRILRVCFPSERGLPVCRESSAAPAEVEHADMRGRTRSEVIAAAYSLARLPFDLDRGPLLRLKLFQLEERLHVLVLAMHHIISDMRSVGILVQELLALLEGRELPPISRDYDARIAWQRETFTPAWRAAEVEYWRQRLRTAPEVLALPSDRPRPAQMSGRAASVVAKVAPELTSALEARAGVWDSTPFLLYSSAFHALLLRYGGLRSLVVATPTASRSVAERSVVGLCSNTMLIPIEALEDATLQEIHERVKASTLESHRHRVFPTELLVDELSAGRVRPRSHEPLAQVCFNYMHTPMGQLPAGGALEVVSLPASGSDPQGLAPTWWRSLDTSRSSYDLNLIAWPDASGTLTLSLEYSTDLFDAATAEDLLRAYRWTLETWVEGPAERVSTLRLPPRLVELARRSERRRRPFRLVIASTFVCDGIRESIEHWGHELDWPIDLVVAPYAQVFQTLLDPAGPMAQPGAGLHALLLRVEDWLGEGSSDDRRARAIETCDALIEVLKGRSTGVPLVVAITPAEPALASLADAATARLSRGLSEIAGIHVMGPQELFDAYPVDTILDPVACSIGHVPYTRQAMAVLGTRLARRAVSTWHAPVKVLAVDADHTLWRGVVGEDGPEGLVLDEGRRALQRDLARQAEAGVLVCIVSRNEPADVDAAFAAHPEWPLTPAHVAARRVGWGVKGDALRGLAEELSLGLDTFLFLDDDPVEVAAVRAQLPMVRTICVGRGALPVDLLGRVWSLDRGPLTAEDRRRSDFYREEAAREALRGAMSLNDFLAALELVVTIEAMTDAHVERVAQLTVRTTQFNCAPHPRTALEVSERRAAESWWVVSVRDRFGDYGLVGVLAGRREGTQLSVHTFLLSCRALGRGVEHQMLASLRALAEREGCSTVFIEARTTVRNRPARAFLDALAAPHRGERGYAIPLSTLAALPPWPDVVGLGRTKGVLTEIVRDEAPPPAPEVPDERFARELGSVGALLAAIDRARRTERAADVAFEEPATPTERHLAELWSELLQVDRVGALDGFFDLGGHSLLGVVLLSRIQEAFGVELPFRLLLEGVRLRGLAQAIDAALVDLASHADAAALLDRLDEMSDEEIQALLGGR